MCYHVGVPTQESDIKWVLSKMYEVTTIHYWHRTGVGDGLL
jgi:hypothetical protein